jgi:hypothetical protein
MGPACGLWFPFGSADQADAAVERLVGSLGRPGRFHHRRSFSTRDTRPIGGRVYDLLGACLCCGPLRPSAEVAGYEAAVEGAFGFRPDPRTISLDAGASVPDDHRKLAEVAAYLAEQTGGVIDLDRPPWSPKRPPWSDASLPGRVHVLFRDGDRKRGRKLVLDAAAMRSWSRHPDCRMPK